MSKSLNQNMTSAQNSDPFVRAKADFVDSIRIVVKTGKQQQVTYSATKYGDNWVVRKNRKAETRTQDKGQVLKTLMQKVSYLKNLKKIPAEDILVQSYSRIPE